MPFFQYSSKENSKSEEKDCDDRSNEEIRLSALDTTISKKDKEAFETWQEHDDAQMDFCEPQGKEQSLVSLIEKYLYNSHVILYRLTAVSFTSELE